MKKLTARQQQILDLISRVIEQTGVPPTRAEIASELGFRSVNAAEEHLKALAKKGVIEITSGIARGIRLPQVSEKKQAEDNPSSLYQVPLVGRVAAGSPLLSQEYVESEFQLDPALFSEKPDFLLKVRGLSMRDIGIIEGDLIAVRKTQNVKPGQIIVARLGDEVTVKRLQKNGQQVELHSENPDFQPIIVHPEDDFFIEGLVVGLVRPMQ